MKKLTDVIKEVIADAVLKEINSWNLTQKGVATKLGITQSRVSNLMKKKYEEFSVEYLLELFDKCELHLDVKVTE